MTAPSQVPGKAAPGPHLHLAPPKRKPPQPVPWRGCLTPSPTDPPRPSRDRASGPPGAAAGSSRCAPARPGPAPPRAAVPQRSLCINYAHDAVAKKIQVAGGGNREEGKGGPREGKRKTHIYLGAPTHPAPRPAPRGRPRPRSPEPPLCRLGPGSGGGGSRSAPGPSPAQPGRSGSLSAGGGPGPGPAPAPGRRWTPDRGPAPRAEAEAEAPGGLR